MPASAGRPRWYVWILGPHTEIGSGARTHLGDLLTRAKYHGDQPALQELVGEVAAAVAMIRDLDSRYFGFAGAQSVVAVPFRPGKRRAEQSVPHMVASISASILDIPDLSALIQRVDTKSEAKRGTHAKADWFRCAARVEGQRVLIADDLLRTGGTLRAVAECIMRQGAASVVGLCVTRAYGGLVSR